MNRLFLCIIIIYICITNISIADDKVKATPTPTPTPILENNTSCCTKEGDFDNITYVKVTFSTSSIRSFSSKQLKDKKLKNVKLKPGKPYIWKENEIIKITDPEIIRKIEAIDNEK